MSHFARRRRWASWQTFVAMGIIYFVAMMSGAFGYRVPPPDWKPRGSIRPPPTPAR